MSLIYKLNFCQQENVQKCGDVVLKTFDELTVRLSLDETNLQHRKLVFQLITPHIQGFSYVPESEAMDVQQNTENVTQKVTQKEGNKRKDPETKASKKKSKRK